MAGRSSIATTKSSVRPNSHEVGDVAPVGRQDDNDDEWDQALRAAAGREADDCLRQEYVDVFDDVFEAEGDRGQVLDADEAERTFFWT